MLTLYHATNSVCSQKARLVLAEKNLPWTSALVDLGKGEQFSPTYLALNPEAVVPTLVDGDLAIRESSLVLEYVDEVGEGPRLMPLDKAARVATKLWLIRTLAIHDAVNSLSFASYIGAMVHQHRNAEEIEADLSRLPNPQVPAKRRDLFANGARSVFVEGAIGVMSAVFRDMEDALMGSAYLTGSSYGLADLALTAYDDRMANLGFEGFWAGRYDRVGPWLDRMRSRPSHETAIGQYLDTELLGFMSEQGGKIWSEIAPHLDVAPNHRKSA